MGRAEIDALKQQGDNCETACRQIMSSGDEHDSPVQGLPVLSGLSDWCLEVDAALGLPYPEYPEGLDEMENQLAMARARANEMDSDLVSAKARMEIDLNDLENLLGECTAIQQQLALEAS